VDEAKGCHSAQQAEILQIVQTAEEILDLYVPVST